MNKKKILNKKYFLSSVYKKQNLLKFINRIYEKGFLKNKDLESAPWKYLKKKNFNFYFLSNQKLRIIGAIVIINTKYSCHLSFLYLDHGFRNIGLGKSLVEFFFSIAKKNLLTVHIYKKNIRVFNFYKNFGFKKATNSCFLKFKNLLIWKMRVKKFDKKSLKKRYLLYYIKK
jgi:ribosomal protein S18 acetylase RimI-like enzyme